MEAKRQAMLCQSLISHASVKANLEEIPIDMARRVNVSPRVEYKAWSLLKVRKESKHKYNGI